ncbi:hypothetical protein C2845_PM04G06560 [Panicum miliaceum]|uniref:GDSL esterase/lipase n=1 Tax=Panicum miliaceum TaxID=4540 RepID=A0A3L6QP55_PANMI|nr:hypothetical protein C2845_PM04G06560 [Panicum miliaceum]
MKKIMLSCFLLAVVLIINGAHEAECRPHRGHRHRRDDCTMFVFGDSLVDAGNRPPTAEKTWSSREWFYPYGSSDSAHGNRATGRSSDGLVQSDFLARILGQDESPVAYRLRQPNAVDPSGVNFAMAGSAVTASQGGAPSLGDQIDQFRRLDSVALIAFSGLQDYSGLNIAATSDDVNRGLGRQVDRRDRRRLERLQDLGVSKVLVNSMPPIGCQPYRTWMSSYAQCDGGANRFSDTHNAALRKKLNELEGSVLVLDLASVFSDLVQSENKYRPCCDGTSKPEGYCGEEDASGRAQYSNSEDFFYWDYVHPTQAGWKAAMERFEQPILDFLEIYS